MKHSGSTSKIKASNKHYVVIVEAARQKQGLAHAGQEWVGRRQHIELEARSGIGRSGELELNSETEFACLDGAVYACSTSRQPMKYS